MTARPRTALAKGSRWRAKVAVLLAELGTVEKRGLGYAGDDLAVQLRHTQLSVECKDHTTYDLAGWVEQAVKQAPAGSIPLVMAHRARKDSAEEGYVVMRGRDFVTLMKELHR